MELNLIEKEIIEAPLPVETKTYKPVPHERMISLVHELCAKSGFRITHKNYIVANDNKQMTFQYRLAGKGYSDNEEIGMQIAGQNSYDKSATAKFAAGANVFVCMNGMVSGDIAIARKHTGSVLNLIEDKIYLALEAMSGVYDRMLLDAECMKLKMLTFEEIASHCGRLFLEKNVISSSQLNIVKNELKTSEHFSWGKDRSTSLWNLYNCVTESLKKSHAGNYLKNHIDLHEYVNAELI